MINFQDEISRFKPSLEVEKIENAITATDLTDMNDLMMDIIRRGSVPEVRRPSVQRKEETSQETGNTREGL